MPRPRDLALRERIIDAATPRFYARGIQNVGMSELVEAAGCGKSAMYGEFATKDDLVLAYLEAFAERRARRERRVLTDDDPRAAVVALVRDLAAMTRRADFRGCPFRNYLREFDHPDTEAARYVTSWLRDARRRLGRLVGATGVEKPEQVADQIWLAMDGLWSSAPYPDRRRLGDSAVALVERLVA